MNEKQRKKEALAAALKGDKAEFERLTEKKELKIDFMDYSNLPETMREFGFSEDEIKKRMEEIPTKEEMQNLVDELFKKLDNE